MSEGQTRITALEEPNPSIAGNYVPAVTSFRSNTFKDHFVVSLSEEGRDESPMGYVDLRSALDLVFHFVGIANDLGARLRVLDEVQSNDARVAAFEHGYRLGRDGEERHRLSDLDNIAAKLRELADELS